MNLNLSAIGKFIQDGRKHYEMTQAELAEKLGVSPQSVSNWERGESVPDVWRCCPIWRRCSTAD